jgi:hypothetical protein
MDLERAKACILSMHGNHRIPTLLKPADQISRQQLDPSRALMIAASTIQSPHA